jgi:hypothetical protein
LKRHLTIGENVSTIGVEAPLIAPRAGQRMRVSMPSLTTVLTTTRANVGERQRTADSSNRLI